MQKMLNRGPFPLNCGFFVFFRNEKTGYHKIVITGSKFLTQAQDHFTSRDYSLFVFRSRLGFFLGEDGFA